MTKGNQVSGVKRLGALIVAGALLAVITACGTPDGSGAGTALAGAASVGTSPSAESPTMTGQPGSAVAATVPSETAAAPAAAAPQVAVPEELQFTATTLDGASFSGASLAGLPAVLWFWAPWCPNCRAEAPEVAAAAAAYEGRVRFVGVAAQDDLAPMKSFVENYGVGGFEHLADLDASIWQRFGVTQQPAFAFIGADGAVDVVKSRMSDSELTDKLAELTAS